MSVQVIIDTPSKRDAELIAAELPGQPQAGSWRGYGVIRLRFQRQNEAKRLLPLIGDCVERHGLDWARLRIGDDHHMVRGRKAASS